MQLVENVTMCRMGYVHTCEGTGRKDDARGGEEQWEGGTVGVGGGGAVGVGRGGVCVGEGAVVGNVTRCNF